MKKYVYLSIMIALIFLLSSCDQNPIIDLPDITDLPDQTDLLIKTDLPDKTATSKAIQEINQVFYPDESYIGEWYSTDYAPDILTISKIEKTVIEINIEYYRTRLPNVYATAKVVDDAIEFEGHTSQYDDPTIAGTLEFSERGVLVIFNESDYLPAGYSEDYYIKGTIDSLK